MKDDLSSVFTLIADSKRQKGTRPDFSGAARPEVAEPLYERFCEALVSIVNDGPVTIVLDA